MNKKKGLNEARSHIRYSYQMTIESILKCFDHATIHNFSWLGV